MLPTGPRTVDRRSLRTRSALRDALLSLLSERGWDDVSVQDICARADVGRSTFYVHYQSKEHLLAGSLSGLHAMLRAQADAGDGGAKALSFARGLIEHIDEQRQTTRSIIGRRSSHAVQMRFREMVVQLVDEDLSRCAAASWQREAAARYVGGALVELLAWWVEAGGAHGADAIEQLFHQFTAPVLTQLETPGEPRPPRSPGMGQSRPAPVPHSSKSK